MWIGLEGWLFGTLTFDGPPAIKWRADFLCPDSRRCLHRDSSLGPFAWGGCYSPPRSLCVKMASRSSSALDGMVAIGTHLAPFWGGALGRCSWVSWGSLGRVGANWAPLLQRDTHIGGGAFWASQPLAITAFFRKTSLSRGPHGVWVGVLGQPHEKGGGGSGTVHPTPRNRPTAPRGPLERLVFLKNVVMDRIGLGSRELPPPMCVKKKKIVKNFQVPSWAVVTIQQCSKTITVLNCSSAGKKGEILNGHKNNVNG